MEIIIGLIAAALTWVVTLYATYIMAAIYIYVSQEINHTFRNIKRELKQAAWDIEWQLKLMKGK